jgi:zinc protease
MIQRSLPASIALLAAALLPAGDLRAADPIPLAHEGSDIAPDAAVTWGLLENGMRYAILPNAEPPDRVSMRLYVDAGSLMENDDQQGLAHFLEHMAFNGTKNFPAGEMVEYFQRLGMGFGNHTNAHTSFNETVYKLELPKAEAAMIDEGLTLFRDFADGMLLDSQEIEDERGIVLSEKRTRDSVGWRTFVEQLAFAFPEQLVSRRLPIGTEEVISGAPRERFVEFYEQWYTPDRMAVVVVGDVEAAAVEEAIRRHFGSLPAREKRPAPPMGEMAKRGFATHYHHEREAGETSVSIEALKPRVDPPDDSRRRLEDLELTLAHRIVNRRLERLVKEPGSPLSSASMNGGDFFELGFALHSSIDADCKPEDWQSALALIEQELRRALEHGFTEAELTEAKANVRRAFEDAAKQMATRQSRNLADQIASRLGSRRVFTSPADDLPRVVAALDSIDAERCRARLAGLWESANETLVLVSGNAVVEEPATAIAAAFEQSRLVAVAAPEETEVGDFAYDELPKAGPVASREEVEDLAVTRLRFANEVRANLKPTDFEAESIHVKIRFGSGLITQPTPGLAFFLGGTFVNGGLEAHSDDELKALFAGRSVSVHFDVADDAFTLSGRTTPEALEDQLVLMRAYLTNPGFREEAEVEFRGGLDYLYQQLERTPGGFSQYEVARFLRSGDERFGFPPRPAVEALSLSQAREWIQPSLEKGYLEISLVGDFDREAAAELLARTFGNLPAREAEKPRLEDRRLVSFPEGQKRDFTFPSEIPKAMVTVHWPTTDIFEIERTRRLGMLSAILDDRLRKKIREELGDAYSPFAHNLPSDTWKGYGYLFASVTVDPAQAAKVETVVSEIAAELATGTAIDEDELERARKPQLVSIEEMRRTNRYWMGSVLEASQEYPQRLDWSRSFVDDYRNISVEEINALAAEFLKAEAQVSVSVLPAPEADGGKSE